MDIRAHYKTCPERSRGTTFVAALIILTGTLGGCSRSPSPPEMAIRDISASRLMEHIRTLASDKFEGRLPGTNGEKLTVDYLEGQFGSLGLEPGNPDGTYVQKVPLVGITADSNMTLTFSGHGRTARAKYQDDFIAATRRVTDSVSVDAEMVFVGYGVQAPEFQWDDFKGTDVKGKVLLVLVNDPPVSDEKVFGGKAMTYYGRWTYKFEKAAELGAAGCLIIHETGPAGYGWSVVQNSWSGEQFDLVTPDKNMHRAAMEGWISNEMAQSLLKTAGKTYEALKQAAVSRDFRPISLGYRVQLTIRNSLRTVDSRNVIAKLTGSDAKLKNEYVIYTAHWDHLGIGKEVDGDKIYNGARDNASGTAALLEIARAFKQLQIPPRRSLLFLAVTAEEQGLLGSSYYAANPLYPLARTAAVVNMDMIQVFGRTQDVVIIGKGLSTLDDATEAVARELGRVVKPDPEPEKGFYYRSDHFEFAKEGVPALNVKEGTDYIGRGEGWGLEMRQKFQAEHYHKPSDDVKADWDLSGLAEDCQLYFLVGYRVANHAKMPEWKPGTEFKARREASLRQTGSAN